MGKATTQQTSPSQRSLARRKSLTLWLDNVQSHYIIYIAESKKFGQEKILIRDLARLWLGPLHKKQSQAREF